MDVLLRRNGPFAGPGFNGSEVKVEPKKAFDYNVPIPTISMLDAPVLVIGSGGLGCELLKNLGLLGFSTIHVIDMDTIDISNLNRQFLFSNEDVGRPKAIVAAETIMKRIPYCNIIPHHAKIQDFSSEFYSQFSVIVCGLDSVEARRWINAKVVALNLYPPTVQSNNISTSSSTSSNYDAPRTPNTETSDDPLVIPLVDGGTEGLKGQSRVIVPGITACYECSLDMQTKPKTFPICTIANTPRLPEHCVQYASIIQWPELHSGVKLDGDNPEHVEIIMNYSQIRASTFGINHLSITFAFTQGIIKNIIPAIASTNAIVAASCATEVFKFVSNCSPGMNNYMMYIGDDGVYTYTFALDRKEGCSVCGSSKAIISINDLSITVQELIDMIKEQEDLRLKDPSITVSSGISLYLTAPASLNEATRSNLNVPVINIIRGITEYDIFDLDTKEKRLQTVALLENTMFVVTDKSLFDVSINVFVKYNGSI